MPKFTKLASIKTWAIILGVAFILVLLPKYKAPVNADSNYYYNPDTNQYYQMNNAPVNNYPVYNNPSPTYSNNGSFTLNSNNNYCVGQVPTYTITAPSNWAGQSINWTSRHNGSVNSQNTYTLGSGGSWSANGNAWDSSSVGSWQKTASINGASQTLSFNVQNCGGTVNNPPATSGTGFGGSVGSYSDPTIGGSTGDYNNMIGNSTTGQPFSSNNSGNNSSGRSAYYDQNGYYCTPPTR